MGMSPLLFFHICAATVGLLSGAVAMAVRKGSGRHGVAGTIFFGSMLLMSSSGAYIAWDSDHAFTLSVLNGVLTFYLVATGWLAAVRRTGKPGIVDFTALAMILAVGASLAASGFQAASSPTGLKHGFAAPGYFVFGFVALLAAAGDIRMIVRGGITGAKRIARHLWRMSFALWIAAASFFLGQAKLFSGPVRKSGILFVPVLLVIVLMVYWLIRVRYARAFNRTDSHPPSARTHSAAVHPASAGTP
jgi:hypothetical protein